LQIVDLSGRPGPIPSRQTLNGLLTMPNLDFGHVRSAYQDFACTVPSTLVPALPRTYVLFVWLGFALAAFLYAYDWHPSGWSVLRKQEAAVKPQRREGENYTGSIVIVPGGGDLCRQRIIDNRIGKMWDKGYVNCYEAVAPQEKDQRVGMSSARINAIGKAFNHDN